MKTPMYLWEIKTVRWSGKKGKPCVEYIVAQTIDQVWEDYLKWDRMDQGVEIEAVKKIVPVLRVLESQKTPL